MKRLEIYFAIVLFFVTRAHAANYYISTTGSDSGNGSSGQPWSTFDHAWTVMHAGDTLIVNCGTYTQHVRPSISGSAGAYITIQAATDWCVTVDGGSLSENGTLRIEGFNYIVVRGIKFAGTPSGNTLPVDVTGTDHVKLIKIASYNAPCSGNNHSLSLGPSNSYLLVEDSYSWGCGRYKFHVYQSDHVILRHVVARHDFHDPTGSGNWGAQSALFNFYDSYQFLCQNCIGIDSGETSLANGTIWGGIWDENNDPVTGHGTSGQNNSGKFEGDIFLNIITNAPYIAAGNDPKLVGTREVVDTAMVNNDSGFQSGTLNLETDSLLLHHMTIYNVTGTHTSSFNAGGVGVAGGINSNVSQNIIQDSTIQKAHDFGVSDYINSNYNLFYQNGANFGTTVYQGNTPTAGAYDIQGTNPQLKYITRVEGGAPGKGTASDGGDRGATILYRMGTPGTLWGDAGYDTLTSTPLWPWDDQATIKTDMASYNANGVSGARGFAANGNGLYGGPITLTSYIWEQLGNACPGDCQTQSAFLSSASVGTNYTLTVSTAGTGSGTVTGTNCASGTYASGTTYTCTATPNSGSTFAGWTGTCGGAASANTDSGTVTSSCTLTATFSSSGSNVSLTVSKTGTGNGTLSGTNCASGTYASGTSVTCTATPGTGSTFAGWSGACGGTGSCAFTLSADSTVTATFNLSSGGTLALGLGTCSSTMSGKQYVAFSGCTLAASGGTPPYTYSWKVVTDGSYASLPEGLSLGSSTGTISGTVYGQGRYVPQFVVTDSASNTATLTTLAFSLAGDSTLGGCSLFPSDSIFHQRVDSLPVDASPAAPIPSTDQASTMKAFFGTANGNLPNGIPFVRVPYNQANVSITTSPYYAYFTSGPIPSYAPIEDTSNSPGTDEHVLVLQMAGGGNPCKLWEMYQGAYTNPGWSDSGQGYWANLGSTGASAYTMPPQELGTVDAAGLPMVPLLLNADEVIGTGTPSAPNGAVQHPVRFTITQMLNKYVWPGTHHAGGGSCSGGYGDGNGLILQGSGAPGSCTQTGPSGEIYRLKASVATPSCAATSPQAAIIIQGFRNYGIILADNGGNGGLIGTPDARWNDSDLACLHQLTLGDFEPVNVSGVAAALSSNYNGSGYSAPVTSYQTTSGSANLTGITVTPATASLAAGTGTQQYTAQCAYSNGINSDCSSTVAWSSSNPAAATISSGGVASGVAAGSSTIKATSGSVAGSATLTVINSTLTSITVTPVSASIVAGTGTQQYAAQCSYSNNTSANCTTTVIWSSSNTAAARISSGGLATAVAAGNATIKAVSGSVSGSAALTVRVVPVNPPDVLWAWMGGSSTIPGANQGRAGVYNALGTPAAENIPGSRSASVGWTDVNGNLWLFGGGGFDASGVDGYLNDLWEYLPSLEEWVWMGGSSTVPGASQGWPGAYGTQDVPNAHNSPGSREGSVSWTDKTGNFWLFGGIGFDSAGTNGRLNDLWEFNPTTKEWTWWGGSSVVPSANGGQPGVYGQPGVPDPTNLPGSRSGASSWTDPTGNLWLFGGLGYDATGSLGSLNDLWQLDLASHSWVWMGGSSTVGSLGGQPGVYGSLGTPAPTNLPSGRSQAASWTDARGNFWLFGGAGYDSTGTLGYLNDLWQFNPTSREWAWMGGSDTVGCTGCARPGEYGTQGQADSANVPGGRNQAVGWTDSNGNLWLLGGNGYDAASTYGALNDLWEFLPSTQNWAWIGGSSTVPAPNQGQVGVYGQMGIPAEGNTPGGRGGSYGWNDNNGNLWLFGGSGYDAAGTNGTLNDLWVYQPTAGNLPAATPVLSVASGAFNAIQTVTITDITPGATIYYTTDGTTPGTGSSPYRGPITVSSSTTIQAIASATNYKESAIASATYTITPAFSVAPLTGSTTNVSVRAGGLAKFELVVTPVGSSTFITAVTLSATGLPTGATATFAPSTVAAGLGATNVSLNIQTSTASASNVPGASKWTIALSLLFIPLIGLWRFRAFNKRLSTRTSLIASILLLAGTALGVTGCAGTVVINKPSTGTPTPYTITVTAASGQTQKSTTVTITVQ